MLAGLENLAQLLIAPGIALSEKSGRLRVLWILWLPIGLPSRVSPVLPVRELLLLFSEDFLFIWWVQYFSGDKWQLFHVTLPKQCTENAYAFFLALHVIVFRFLHDVCALCCLASRDVLVGISISLCLFLQTYFRVLICCWQ